MREVYETVDGKQFYEKEKALNHESKLDKKAKERINILKKEAPFLKMDNPQEEYYLEVAKDYDGVGNWGSLDILKGTKVDLVRYIAYNSKYWFMSNHHYIRDYKDRVIEVTDFLSENNKWEEQR